MRILIVTDAWTPQVNGVARTYQKVNDILLQNGDTVKIIHPGMYRNFPLFWYPEIKAAYFPFKKVRKEIEAFQPDAIHVATEGSLGIVTRHLCSRRNWAFTTAFHTRMPEYGQAYFRLPKPISYQLLRWFHKYTTHIMVPTEQMAALLQAHGMPRLRIWSRGVDTTLFYPMKSDIFQGLPRPILLYVGRVAVEKNIQAFVQLKTEGTKVVVGDGPMKKKLERLHPDIHFVGYQTGTILNQYYSNADVCVFPSHTDTFGQVILESLACGTPVAANRVPGPLDILGNTQLDTLDNELEKSVQKALQLPRSLCIPFVRTYSWEASVAKFRAHLVPANVRPSIEISQALQNGLK